LSNSIKYAFSEKKKGIIDVEFFAEKDNNYTLIIKDNGAGFPDNINYRNTQTLGLQLVMILVDQLEGQIKLENQNGTKFTINFTEKITS
jgi:two-component sensor histidine kinase